jgi:hypothetical protein
VHLPAIDEAKNTLLSDRKNNEYFIINLVTVRAEEILFPTLLQAAKR